MASVPSSVSLQDLSTAPQLAEVLPLVMATVPLSKYTKTTLRCVCRGTKLAVDQLVLKMTVPLERMQYLRLNGNTLTSGLTSLVTTDSLYSSGSASAYLKSANLAISNSQTLENLNLVIYSDKEEQINGGASVDRHAAMRLLGSCPEWPRLRSLTLWGGYNFQKYINIDSMPNLIELYLEGDGPRAEDVAALTRSARFVSNVETLKLRAWNNSVSFTDDLGTLLKDATRLRHLDVKDRHHRGLGFLVGPELPNLEDLKLSFEDFPEEFSLFPIVSVCRPRLRTLSVRGLARRKAGPASLLPLKEGAPLPLPALENLILYGFNFSNLGVVLEAGPVGLKTLELCPLQRPHVAGLAAVIARLPALEGLVIVSSGGFEDRNTAAAAMRTLLSGAPMPRLRQLDTDWPDSDASLRCLIEFADKVPNLEKIAMRRGWISLAGVSELAAAGRQGRWPGLNHFTMFEVAGTGETASDDEYDEEYEFDYDEFELNRERVPSILRAVWPDLKVGLVQKDEMEYKWKARGWI